ncbi:MAG: YjgP/YjgQ family permease [Candidatus Omnitrophica bacterium]|nr:YjgP/YjgQ family permease [Candidatus Omnitrophota bacterium]
MTILQRYVLREIWLPFVLSLATLNFIFMGGYLVRVSRQIIGQGIPLSDTLYLLFLALPEMISYTVPTSLLAAVLLVVGGLSQNNEIRAMRASGIDPMKVMRPAFLMGLALSFFMFVFNDQVASYTSFKLRLESKRMILKNPMSLIEPGRFVKISDSVTFHAKQVLANHELRDIVAYENPGADQAVRTIIAERGEVVSSKSGNEIQIRLYDGTISDADGKSVQSIQFKTYEFPTLGQEDPRLINKKVRECSLAEIFVKLAKKGLSAQDVREAWSIFHQRIAFAFGCFLFVFVGIPVAILVNRGEIVFSFGIAMAAASMYYILFAGAKSLAFQGVLPPVIAFWLPNMILLGLGAHFSKKSFNL